jgi:hypothetical protein
VHVWRVMSNPAINKTTPLDETKIRLVFLDKRSVSLAGRVGGASLSLFVLLLAIKTVFV